MPKVLVPVSEEIFRSVERRKAAGMVENIAQSVEELVNLGFQYRLHELYGRYADGEISLGCFAKELGLGTRELSAQLEQRGLPTANVGGRKQSTR
ncbi:hypothetical protein GW813_12940 [bacterium]|nr:hypothetical protein [bacterium]